MSTTAPTAEDILRDAEDVAIALSTTDETGIGIATRIVAVVDSAREHAHTASDLAWLTPLLAESRAYLTLRRGT